MAELLFQKWLMFDFCFSACLGFLLFLFPNFLLKYVMVQSCDGIHFHMARVAGSVLIGQCLTWWRWSKATSPYLGTSAMTARLISHIFCLAATIHARTFYHEYFFLTSMKIFTAFNVICGLITLFLIVYHTWIIGEFLHEAKKQRFFNFLIQLDALMALCIGIVFCAFPDLILHTQAKSGYNGTHLFICQCFGSWLLSTSTLSSRALYFEKTEDRTNWGMGRSLICVLIYSSQVYSQYAYPESWTNKHWVGASIFLLWAGTCWFGSFQQYRGAFR